LTSNYSSITQNTNLPIYSDQAKTVSSEKKQRNFFGNYHTKVGAVNPVDYDLIRGYLLGKNMDESSIDNLSITLVEVAKEQGIEITELIDLLDTGGDLNLNTVLCILLNTTRNRTSVVGFRAPVTTSSEIRRLIDPKPTTPP
jgi:hypothetical protein